MENKYDSIEISNIKALNKGAFIAVCDIYLPSVNFKMLDVKIFEKNNSQWVGLYTKEFINANGQTKHKNLISFDTEEDKLSFTNKVLFVVNKFLEKENMNSTEIVDNSMLSLSEEAPF